MDLVEFDDGVTSCGAALFKTVEALSRGVSSSRPARS